eukprot:Em0008g354a
MATPYPYAQEFAKANEKIDEASKEIEESYPEIQQTYQKIEETNQEIEAILNSNEYKAVAKHFAWGKPIPGTSAEDKALFSYFQLKLDNLNSEKQGLNKTIERLDKQIERLDKQIERLDKQNAAAFKKTFNHYKHKAAVKSVRTILTTVAHFLRERYVFQQFYEQVTFGDVMTAVGFRGELDVHDYFRSSKSKSTGTETVPMQEVFTENEWCTLLELNKHVNEQLHGIISEGYAVLEGVIFKSSAKSLEAVLKKMGFDNVDIKDADSDSASDKDSPEKQEHC